MVREEGVTLINRPAGDVFAYVTDVTRFAEWSDAVQEARLVSDPPLRVGSIIRETISVLGRRVASDMEVAALEPDHLFARRSISGPLRMTITAELEPQGATTRVTWTIVAEAARFSRVAEPLLRRLVNRQIQTTSGKLKELLEVRVA